METNAVLYSIESCSFAKVARSVLPNKISSRLLQVLFLFHLLSLKYSAEGRMGNLEITPVGLLWWKKKPYIYIPALF